MIINRWNRFLRSPEGDPPAGGGGSGDQQQQQQTPPGSILGAGGQDDKPWYSALAPEYQTNPYVAQSKDINSFVKSAIDTKGMVGANTIKLPSDKATDAELGEFYTKLGRPAEATGYTPTVKPAAEGLVDAPVMEHMQTTFHKLGLTAAQGQGVLDAYLSQVNTGYEASTAQETATKSQGVATLKTEWGPKYDNNVKTAQLAINKYGGPELMAKIDGTGLGNDVDFIKFMHTMGLQLLDDDALSGESGGSFGGTPMAAQQEIEALKMDTDFQTALNTREAPGHKAAVDRWLAVHQKAFPGKKPE